MLKSTCLAVALGVCAITTALAQATDAYPFPPPGVRIDIGGWSLHLNCSGPFGSGPTVVLEAGSGDFSPTWTFVQPRVESFARVCSYDRAGSGWSDLGPSPRTIRQVAYELHTLLRAAGERPPFVVVGQSYGGLYVRAFASAYPDEVHGMVLIDSAHEDDILFINGRMIRQSELATGEPIPPVKTSNPLKESDIPANVRQQIEAAVRQLGPRVNDAPYNKLPPDVQRIRTWALSQVKHFAANDNRFVGDEIKAMSAARTEFPLGDRPLMILTRGTPVYPGDRQEERQRERDRTQKDLATLSRRSRQIVVPGSDHEIHIDAPDVVVDAIRRVVSGKLTD
jgi:pimeloyl-ACP methyl ester carboxylesterase